MTKLSLLFQNVDFGDYRTISELYNNRHKETDKATVSSSYVSKLIREERPALTESTKEVLEIARTYIESKKRLKLEIIAE